MDDKTKEALKKLSDNAYGAICKVGESAVKAAKYIEKDLYIPQSSFRDEMERLQKCGFISDPCDDTSNYPSLVKIGSDNDFKPILHYDVKILEKDFVVKKGETTMAMSDLFKKKCDERAEELKKEEPNEPIENQDDWIWVEGYKGTDKNGICRDFQFCIGKRFDMPEDAEIKECSSGFHLCLSLKDVFPHYGVGKGNRFFRVRALVRRKDYYNYGRCELSHYPFSSISSLFGNDKKLVSKSIEFLNEVSVDDILEAVNVKDLNTWTEEDKNIAISRGINEAYENINIRKLTELGYSRTFAAHIVKKRGSEYFDKACAIGTQTDVSMDMKVLYILY